MSDKYDDYDWDELPKEAMDAAKTLGYTKKMWDADKEPKICDKYWGELKDNEKAAAAVLGYDEKAWDAEDDSSSSSED